MRLILLITFLVSCAGSAALGVRLIAAGLRTRTAPELAYGGSLLLTSLAAVVRLVVHGVLGGGPEYHGWMVVAGALRLGTLMALTFGIRAIFRPREVWAVGLMGALWIFGTGGLAVVLRYPGGLAEVGVLYQLGDFASALAVFWALVESVRYHRKLTRRLAIGLGDPLITQRFGVWSVGFACALGANATLIGGSAWVGGAITGAPFVLAAVQTFLLATTIATWWAFYPPSFLRARALARHAARVGA